MNNTARLADQFSNIATMFCFVEVDRKLIAAFDNDDHNTVAICGEMYDQLIIEVCKFVPAANA